MRAKLCIIPIAVMFVSGAAMADVYKCETPDGLVYTEKPCAGGVQLQETPAPPTVPPQPQTAQRREAAPPSRSVNDVNAVPLRFPERQRRTYQEFLMRPSPRAFGICSDGSVITIVGNADFVRREMNDVEHGVKAGCHIYAADNEVVWRY